MLFYEIMHKCYGQIGYGQMVNRNPLNHLVFNIVRFGSFGFKIVHNNNI